ncbi:hypothetical protein [Dactylosporangium maewongense]|uniref:hypothetical protein n=1 Tax=Dactylosporangium maewongense TaxID=634393 RepID=UPI0031DCF5A1
MHDEPDPSVEPARWVALAEELTARPFPTTPTGADNWVVGQAQSGPDRHFAPLASSEILEDAPGERWAEVEDDFERRRGAVVSTLTAAWGEPQTYSFDRDFDRLIAGEALPTVIQDLTYCSFGHHADTWRRGDRTVCVVLGQVDKHFPIMVLLAVIMQPLP